jgi:hypothetical protein
MVAANSSGPAEPGRCSTCRPLSDTAGRPGANIGGSA